MRQKMILMVLATLFISSNCFLLFAGDPTQGIGEIQQKQSQPGEAYFPWEPPPVGEIQQCIPVGAQHEQFSVVVCLLEKQPHGLEPCTCSVPVYVYKMPQLQRDYSSITEGRLLDFQQTVGNGYKNLVYVRRNFQESDEILIIAGPHPETGEIKTLEHVVKQDPERGDNINKVEIVFYTEE